MVGKQKSHDQESAAQQRQPDLVEWRPGEVIEGLYEVIRLLGKGGMGAVYLVRHQLWNVELAVKTPLPRILSSEKAIERFSREAQVWVNMGKHPHIVTAFYVRNIGGLLRIFVEYVDGWPLGGENGYLDGYMLADLGQALDIAIQISRGMAHAHANGRLVHRDLKSANIMISRDGEAKVTDFGLAKAIQATDALSEEGAELPELSGLTIVGKAMGTMGYMPPEQWQGQEVACAADIYAFGCILYEIFCHCLPFVQDPSDDRSAYIAMQYMHCFAAPPDPSPCKSEFLPWQRIPERLAQLMLRCLAKNPQERPQCFEEIEEILIGIYQEIGNVAYPRAKMNQLALVAADLNNKAVSYLDLGREEEALALLERAVAADSRCVAALLNWRVLQYERNITGCAEILTEAIRFVKAAFPERPEPAVVERAFLMKPVRIFVGHCDDINGVAITPDGRFAVSSSRDNTLRLWEIATGECRRLIRHSDGVYGVAITPDGRLVVSASDDKTVRVWELASRSCCGIFAGHTKWVYGVAITSDSRLAISASHDKTLRVWDIANGKCRRILSGHSDFVEGVAITPDGRLAVSASWDRTLRVWDIANGICRLLLEGHSDFIEAVAITPDGRLAVSASWDRTLRVWDLATGSCRHILVGHTDRVYAVAITPDGQLAVSGGKDKTVRVWQIASAKCLRTINGHTDEVEAVAITPDGAFAISASADKTLRLWEIGAAEPLGCRFYEPVLSTAQALDLAKEAANKKQAAQKKLQKRDYPGAFRIFQELKAIQGYEQDGATFVLYHRLARQLGYHRTGLSRTWCQKILAGHNDWVHGVAVTPDARFVVSASRDNTLWVWELASGKRLRPLKGHTDWVYRVAITADGCFAVSSSRDKTLRVWEIASGKCQRILTGHTDQVHGVATSADSRLVVSASHDKTVRIWDLASGKCRRALCGHSRMVYGVAIAPEGRFAISASADKTMRVWDLASGNCCCIFSGHTRLVYAVAIAPDASFAVSASWDHTLRVWEIMTGKCIRILSGHSDWIYAVAITADSRFVISASEDYTLRVWEIASGNSLITLSGHTDKVNDVALTADARFAVSASDDKTLRIWALDWEY